MKDYAYLICVDGRDNHNKFYEMTENDDYSIDVNYGRVGGNVTHHHYYPYEKDFFTLRRSKLFKGYEDVTHLHQIKETVKAYLGIEDKEIEKFVQKMLDRQERMVSNFSDAHSITPAMIEEARKKLEHIKSLDMATHHEIFRYANGCLTDYFTILPRSMRSVSDFLFKSTNQADIDAVFQREYDLLDALESKIGQDKTQEKVNGTQDILTANGISMEEVTYDEEDLIFDKLKGDVSRYVGAFSVVNNKTEQAFRDNLAKHPMETTLLCHGSPNKNWWSIATKGLDIEKARDGMFAQGIYFAPKPQKSMGYMSTGSYWRGGNDNTGYLALFEVATGKRFTPTSTLHGSPSTMRAMLKGKGCDCVWARTDAPNFKLRNEEVIVYNNNQATIRYIVEISAESRHIPHLIVPFEKSDRINLESAFGKTVFNTTTLSVSVDLSKVNNTVKGELNKVFNGYESISLEYDKASDTFKAFGVSGKQKTEVALQEGDSRYLFRELKRSVFESEKEFRNYKEGKEEFPLYFNLSNEDKEME